VPASGAAVSAAVGSTGRGLAARTSVPLVHRLRLGPVRFHRSDERILDLFLYRRQPLLGACCAAFKTLNVAFQFPNPIFRTSQLKREPVRQSHRSLEVFPRDACCFL
jgi:hypothetical protein